MDLCETIYNAGPPPVFGVRVPGLFLCVRPPLTYLRHNPPQKLLAGVHGVWQSTASRVIAACTPLMAAALDSNVPTVEDPDPAAQLIVDGNPARVLVPVRTTPSLT